MEAEDVELRLVLETHLHNDHIIRGSPLCRRRRAPSCWSRPQRRPATGTVPPSTWRTSQIRDLVVRPIHTPGHTPEHTSYLVLLEGVEEAVFTGGDSPRRVSGAHRSGRS